MAQMPNHTHIAQASSKIAREQKPGNHIWGTTQDKSAYRSSTNYTNMSSQAIPQAGGGQAHNNMQPYLAINYVIALTGIYPSRS
jgi:microcystin-dependent protein